MKDELIRRKTECGVVSPTVRKQLLKERDLTFDRAIDIGIANELSDRKKYRALVQRQSKGENHNVGKGRRSSKKDSKKDSNPDIQNCKNCVGNNAPKQKSCPAFGKKCLYCGKPNQFEKVCRPSFRRDSISQRFDRRRPVDEVSPQLPTGLEEDLFVIDAITLKPGNKHEIYCTMVINGKQVEFENND